jgi:hypothetical protein
MSQSAHRRQSRNRKMAAMDFTNDTAKKAAIAIRELLDARGRESFRN